MSEQVLPFYLVCDESGSMEPAIESMNQELLPDLHQEIGTNPVVADKTRFAIIGFAEDARLLLPLSDLSDLEDIPALKSRNTTSFRAAFELLRETIDNDVAQLKADGHRVLRPAVFFLSDGLPNRGDNWEDAWKQLADKAWRNWPNIIAFGLNDADADVIKQVSTFRAFIADGTVSPAKALAEFASTLTRSMINSVGIGSMSGTKLEMPDRIDGFTTMDVDEL